MTAATLLPLFAQTGVFGLVAWILYRLHRSAVAAHRERATEWNEAYKAERARADEREQQMAHILSAIPATASKNST